MGRFLHEINSKLWSAVEPQDIEHGAMRQICEALKSELPIVHMSIMPDVHQGYSVPIGSVTAIDGIVVPSFVGYDIGCGVCAIPTDFEISVVREYAQEVWNEINNRVPVGFNHRKVGMVWDDYHKFEKTPFAMSVMENADTGFRQLGTLGGGNHFIEIGAGDDGRIWVIIHSGSRNVGHKIGQHYMKIAGGGKAREGHFGFDIKSNDGQDYWRDMNFCLEFALQNRRFMLADIERCMRGVLGRGEFLWNELINRNHNHATEKDGMLIHRKGATHAEEGMLGVIPGNMRDGSFIVRGLGNADSLYSSSHGAGRVLGRKKAKETLSIDEFRTTMKGIVSTANKSTLDESPMAYKDIFEVMDQQDTLVEKICYIKPILNVKGG